MLFLFHLGWNGLVAPVLASFGVGHFEPTTYRDSKGRTQQGGDFVDDRGGGSWKWLGISYGLVLGTLVLSQLASFARASDQDLPAGYVNLNDCKPELWAEAVADPQVVGIVIDGKSAREASAEGGCSGAGCLGFFGTGLSAFLLPATMARHHDADTQTMALQVAAGILLIWIYFAFQYRRFAALNDWIAIRFQPLQVQWVKRKAGASRWQEGERVDPTGLKFSLKEKRARLEMEQQSGPFELREATGEPDKDHLRKLAEALAERIQVPLTTE